jgi:RND family efflux transporter MFP subunit
MKQGAWTALGGLAAGWWALGAAAADFDCMIEPAQVVEVRSPVVGLIEQVHVARGQSIRRGELLVTIESSLEISAEHTARYKAQTIGSLQQAQARVEATQAKARRMHELFEEEFVSGQARDDAQAEFRQAQSELLTAQENSRLAQLEHQQAQDQVQRRVLRSPFDGVVVDQYLYAGSMVDSGESRKPILKIAQTQPLAVRAIVPYAFYPKLKTGGGVHVLPEAPFNVGAQADISARIQTVDRVIDPAAGTFGVHVSLDNRRQQLPAGIRCTLRVDGLEKQARGEAEGGSSGNR